PSRARRCPDDPARPRPVHDSVNKPTAPRQPHSAARPQGHAGQSAALLDDMHDMRRRLARGRRGMNANIISIQLASRSTTYQGTAELEQASAGQEESRGRWRLRCIHGDGPLGLQMALMDTQAAAGLAALAPRAPRNRTLGRAHGEPQGVAQGASQPPLCRGLRVRLIGSPACSSGSVWRNFAFTKKDWYMSTGDELDGKMRSIWPMDFWHKVTLEDRDVGGNIKYVWTYAGHVRTMMEAQPRYYDGSNPGDLIPLGIYDVCGVSDLPRIYYIDQQASYFSGDADRTHEFVKRHAMFKIRLGDDGPCQHVYGGNLDVVIDETYLDHDSTGGDAMNNIGHIDPDSVTMFTANAAGDGTNDAVCATVPDPNKADFRSTGIWYSPYYVGDEHPDWNPSYRSILEPPVFAKDSAGAYRLHDRRYLPLENTWTNPAIDGGGLQTLESVFIEINSFDEDEPSLLSLPNIFNEAHCKLSTGPNVCVRDSSTAEDTVIVTTLFAGAPKDSLARINYHVNNATQKLAMVTGLTMDASYSPKLCDVNTVSRWEVTDDDQTACKGAETLDTATRTLFADMLTYEVTDNSFIVDVRLPTCRTTSVMQPTSQSLASTSGPTANATSMSTKRSTMSISNSGAGDMTSWAGRSSSNYRKVGVKGEMVKLESFLDILDIYKGFGGKDRTAHPTGRPSAAPSYSPSTSFAPTESWSPSSMPPSWVSFPQLLAVVIAKHIHGPKHNFAAVAKPFCLDLANTASLREPFRHDRAKQHPI
ncbi:hypothetical protein THAOC_30129, partial [Thalassiosira oceanica]